jgi:hypothetical protein
MYRKDMRDFGWVRWLAVASIAVAYAAYMARRIGAKAGLAVTYLTWCFLVLATPMADGGGWLNIPVRLITGIPMVTIELVVVAVTLVTSAFYVFYFPRLFRHTAVLRAFYIMLTTPVPYWGIFVVCIIGTLLSVRIGDIIMDKGEAAIRDRSAASFFRAWPMEFVYVLALYAGIWWYFIKQIMPLFAQVMRSKKWYQVMLV